ncbi:MAG: Lrp/AsnC family transcriptional regulator [Sphingomicrobium sp.]
MTLKLDRSDRSLLEALQADSSQTNDALSERAGLSPSAVHRRIRRLESAGVIERRIAVVDPAKVGSAALFVVGIEVERERPELVQPFRSWLRREAAIQQVYYVTGSSDYVLLVTTSDIDSFDQLMSRMMIENPNVRRFTTNVVMSSIKRSLFVPVA